MPQDSLTVIIDNVLVFVQQIWSEWYMKCCGMPSKETLDKRRWSTCCKMSWWVDKIRWSLLVVWCSVSLFASWPFPIPLDFSFFHVVHIKLNRLWSYTCFLVLSCLVHHPPRKIRGPSLPPTLELRGHHRHPSRKFQGSCLSPHPTSYPGY